MAITSTDDGPAHAAIALAGLLALSHLFPGALVGVCGLMVAMIATVAPGGTRRFDIAAMTAAWILVAIMFGPAGAGCFIMAYALVPMTAGLAARAPVGLLVATAVAAVASTSLAPLFEAMLGAGWRTTAELVCILSLGAPGLVIGRMGCVDADTFEKVRVQAIGPQLLLVVIGAALGGLHGVAAAVACGWLATPVMALVLAPDRDLRVVSQAFGILASGLVCAVAIVAAQSIVRDVIVTVVIGLLAGIAALRVHAPDIAAETARAVMAFAGGARPMAPARVRETARL